MAAKECGAMDSNKENILCASAMLIDDELNFEGMDENSSVSSIDDVILLESESLCSQVEIGNQTSGLSDLEDGELESKEADVVKKKKHLNLASDDGYIFDSIEKRHKRAERFGIPVNEITSISEDTLLHLYQSVGIPLHLVRSGKLRSTRLDTIHLHGIKDLNMSDIYKLCEKFKPISVEWVNDISCNVLFPSDLHAANAMLALSNEMDKAEVWSNSREPRSDDLREKEKESFGSTSINSREVEEKIPFHDSLVPPGEWRTAYNFANKGYIFFRFATIFDLRPPHAGKRNTHYERWGDRNYEGPLDFWQNAFSRNCASVGSSNFEDVFNTENHPSSTYPNKQFIASAGKLKKPRHLVTESSPGSFLKNLHEHKRINVEFESSNLRQYKRNIRETRADTHGSSRARQNVPHPACYSDSDDEDNTVSAGGKRIRMRLYADSVKGNWQRISSPPKTKRSMQVRPDLHIQDATPKYPSVEHCENVQQKKLPSRLQVWNPLAAEMAKESKIAELCDSYQPGLFLPKDLRHKISLPSSSHVSSRYAIKTPKDDLRKKLQTKRSEINVIDRSPLLIRVRNIHENDSDTS